MQIHDSVFIDVPCQEIETVVDMCSLAFQSLNSVDWFTSLPGYGLVQVGGELSTNDSMAEGEILCLLST